MKGDKEKMPHLNDIKVVLVNPDIPLPDERPRYTDILFSPFEKTKPEPHIGLLYCAAVLEKAGIDVEIIDSYAYNRVHGRSKNSSKNLVKQIVSKEPSIVGFSLTSPTYPVARENMKELKEKLPDVKIIVGGPLATFKPFEIIKNENVDVLVRGEGEYTLLEAVQTISLGDSLKNVKGILFKDKNSGVHVCEERPLLENLDLLPYPAWHLVDLDLYTRGPNPYLEVYPMDYIASSRGCPFACAFCGAKILWKRHYRYRSAKNVVDEIEFMQDNYGTQGIYFREDNFTINKHRVLELCEEMKKRHLDIPWMCESRADQLSEELLKNMVSYGCRGMWFGIESGSQKMLEYMNKQITLDKIERGIRLCKKYGIRVGGSFMVGLPHETKEDIKKTFGFAKKLNLDVTWFGAFQALPVNEIYDEIKRERYYKHEWEDILIVETPELSNDEIKRMAHWLNNYFLTRRFFGIIKTHRLELLRLIPAGAKVLWNRFFQRPFT